MLSQLILVQELQGNSWKLKYNIAKIFRYGIAPKFLEQDGKPRIEVFNPCDDSDDQKTQTVILFDNDHKFLGFGSTALQRYAELLDDEGSGLLFQSVLLMPLKKFNSVFLV